MSMDTMSHGQTAIRFLYFYGYDSTNSIIWGEICSRKHAVFSTSVWKSLWFSILWTSACSITSLFQTLPSLEVISCPFASPLLSFAIEKLNDRHTSDWQAGGKMVLGRQLTECWAFFLLFCSVLLVLVISLTVDLVEIAGCSPGPQWSGSQQNASHPLKAPSQQTLH